jgi:hypothetical protein
MENELLESIVVPLLQNKLINGVSGINTVPLNVCKPDETPTFTGTEDDQRLPRNPAGVSGIAIRNLGFKFVQMLKEVRDKINIPFDIIGMVGVMTSEDVITYLNLGATAVQTATAAFFNPFLPKEVYQLLGGSPESESELQARSRVLKLLIDKGPMSLHELAQSLKEYFQTNWILLERTRALLQSLETEKSIVSAREEGKLFFQVAPDDSVESSH